MAEGGGFLNRLFGGKAKKKSLRSKSAKTSYRPSTGSRNLSVTLPEADDETEASNTSSNTEEAGENDNDDHSWEDVVETIEESQEIEYVKRQIQKPKSPVKPSEEFHRYRDSGKRSTKTATSSSRSVSKSKSLFSSAFYSRTTSVKSSVDTSGLSSSNSSVPNFETDISYKGMLEQKLTKDLKFTSEEKFAMAGIMTGVQDLFPTDAPDTNISALSLESLIEKAYKRELNLSDEAVPLLSAFSVWAINTRYRYAMAGIMPGVQELFPTDAPDTNITALPLETLIEMAYKRELNLHDEAVPMLSERFINIPRREKRPYYTCGGRYKIPEEIPNWQIMGEKLIDTNKIAPGEVISVEADKLSQDLNQKVALWKGNITQLEVDAIVNSTSSIFLSNRSGGEAISVEADKLSQDLNQKLALWKGNITQLEVDAIINSTSSIFLSNRSEVSDAIGRNAGPLLDYELRKIWYTYVGDVVHTADILHTSGPPGYWEDSEQALKTCYVNCLEKVKQLGIKTLAFCCIGTGAKEMDYRVSARIAIETTHEWLKTNYKLVDKIIFCIYEDFQMDIYRDVMAQEFPVIPDAFAMRASFPPEILRMDSRSKDLYLRALEEGESKVHNIRVMVVGHFDVGKTTLTKRLLGEPVDIDARDSTDGIEVHVKRCRVNLETRKWEVQKYLHKDDSSTRLANVMHDVIKTNSLEHSLDGTDQLMENLKLERSVIEEDSICENSVFIARPEGMDETDAKLYVPDQSTEVTRNVVDERSLMNESVLSEDDSPLMEELKRLVQQVTSSELQDANKYADLSIWDFAGQYAFYGTHQIFLTPRAVYLLVIDLSKHIDSTVENDTCGIDAEGQRTMKISEFVEFWLKSIYFYTREEATVILVGTHADKLKQENREEEAEKLFDNLRDIICLSEYSDCLTEYEVMIDNSIDDTNLEKLKDFVYEVASGKEQYWGKPIPAKWLTLERVVAEMRKEGKKIVERTVIEKVNENLCVPLVEDELELFLQFQHECGLVLYFSEDNLRNYIVLDPQWLIDAFKCFITADMFVKKNSKLRPLWQKFNKQGILTEEFIEKTWSQTENRRFHQHKDHLIHLMEKLDIIARPAVYTENADDDVGTTEIVTDYYFTPCMLKHPPTNDLIDTTKTHNSKSTYKLCYKFESGFAPPAVFNRLLAVCMSKWQPRKRGRSGESLLFCGCGVFDLDSSCVHHLTLYLMGNYIQIWVTRSGEKGDFPERSKCDEARNFIESTLIRLCSLNSSKESVQTYVKCPFTSPFDSEGMVELCKIESNPECCCTLHDPGSEFENHLLKSSDVLRGWTDRRHCQDADTPFLDRSPSDREISTMSLRIGSDWELIGYQLLLQSAELSHIRSDHRQTANCIIEMLHRWRRQAREPTFRTLKEAISAVKGDIQTIFEGFS